MLPYWHIRSAWVGERDVFEVHSSTESLNLLSFLGHGIYLTLLVKERARVSCILNRMNSSCIDAAAIVQGCYDFVVMNMRYNIAKFSCIAYSSIRES